MAVSAHGPRDRLLDHGAGVLDTCELLLLLFGGAEVDCERVAEVSRSIDAGNSARLVLRVNEGTPGEADVVLVAALELAQRVLNTVISGAIYSPVDTAAIARRELGSLRRSELAIEDRWHERRRPTCGLMRVLNRPIEIIDGS